MNKEMDSEMDSELKPEMKSKIKTKGNSKMTFKKNFKMKFKTKFKTKSRIAAWILTAALVCNGLDLTAISVSANETKEVDVQDAAAAEELTESVPDSWNVPDNDELFAEYVQSVLYPESDDEISLYGNWGENNLVGMNAALYSELKTKLSDVANGNASSTKFSFKLSDLGVTKTSWTKAELGGITIVENGSLTDEAKAAALEKLGYDLKQLVYSLMADCPYALYWFDKTKGYSYSILSFTGTDDSVTLRTTSYTIGFQVASAYAADGESYKADTTKTGAAKASAENAQTIVDEYSGLSDYEKLVAYKEKICELVSYNDDAASSSYTGGYGDPWQLIYVFDGDTSTNVVCEGYSKAFQYLCDLSEFSGEVNCYLPTGTMNGGGHMWNIVTIGGSNYMVDVTNSDSGTIGQTGGLFLSGAASGSMTEGYTFNVGWSASSILFKYDANTLSLYDESVLTLADTDYDSSVSAEPLAQFTSRPYDLSGSNNGKTEGSDDFWYTGTVTVTPNQAAGDFKYIRICADSSWTAWGTSASLDLEGTAVTFQIQMTTALKNGKATGSIISESNTETSNLADWKDTHVCKIDTTQPSFEKTGYGISVNDTDTWWQTLPTGISFGKYRAPGVTLLAADAVSGVEEYYYYIDSTEDEGGYLVKTEQELDALVSKGAFTTASGGSVQLPEADGNYIVYAYAVDKAGNRSSYVSSEGITKDDTIPVIDTGSFKTPSEDEGTLGDVWAKTEFSSSEAGTYFYLLHDNTEESAAAFTAPASILDLADSEKGEWTNLVWSAKDGISEGKMLIGDNALDLTGLQSKHSYTLYLAAVDEVGNGTDGVQSITFTTSIKMPEITVQPQLSGVYGTALKDMVLTGGQVESDGNVLSGTWKITDDRQSDVPGVGTTDTYKVTFTPDPTYEGIYGLVTLKVQPSVSKRSVTVRVKDESREYGKENPAFSFEITSGELVGEDTISDLSIHLSTAASRKAVVGVYDITGTSDSVNYEVTVISGQLSVLRAGSAIVTEQTAYVKTYGDSSFTLGCKAVSGEGEEAVVIQEGSLIYTLSDGKDAEGYAKDCSKILAVSEDGTAEIIGSGSVVVTVSRPESANYKAAEDKKITITINKYTAEEEDDGFYVEPVSNDLVYTGAAIKPEPKVYDMDTEARLERNVDYTISYKNNTKAYALQPGEEGFDETKAPVIIIKGKGNYKDVVKVYFTIQPKDINDDDMTAEDMVVEASGKQQLKVPVLAYGKKKLAGVKLTNDVTAANAKKDFVYSYPDLEKNVQAYKETGTYTIHVEGTGNYTGSRDIQLTITAKGTMLSKATVSKIANQTYQDGNPVELGDKLVVTAKVNGKKVTLEENKHYTVSYLDNNEIGTATVILTGTDTDNGDGLRFNGTKKVTFKITGISLAKAKVSGLENKVYSGLEQVQKLDVQLAVKAGSGKNAQSVETTLTEGTDYEVTYSKNLNVGTATVLIKGIGKYTGTIKKTFKITACDLSANQNLIQMSVSGQNISGANLGSAKITASYMKGGSKPEVTDFSILLSKSCDLKENTDFTVSYANNKAITGADTKKQPTITIKGKGNYTGKITLDYEITAKSLQDSSISMTATDKASKTTSKAGAYRVKPVLTDGDGKTLKEGTDYVIDGYAIVNANGEVLEQLDAASIVNTPGTIIQVTVSGKGAYYDGTSRFVTYRITERGMSGLKMAAITKTYIGKNNNVELASEDFATVDGEGKYISKLTMKDGKDTYSLSYGEDFEIVEGSYKKNDKKGTASVTIKGLGKYGGTAAIRFKIVEKSLK